ncbi:Lipoyl-binding domain-containing protein [Citrus sinensis]|nr:Lipoyl-binding domain-containing protein [Citrus sinensis]
MGSESISSHLLFTSFGVYVVMLYSLGASNIKIPKGNLGRARVGDLQPRSDVRKWMGRKPFQYAGLAMSQPLEKAFTVFCGQSSEAESTRNARDGHEDMKSTQLIPDSSEVESLVTDICNTTSVAEFELKLDGFRLYVTRDIAGASSPLLPSSPAPVTVNKPADRPDSNGSVPTPSLAITKPVSSSGGIQTLLDKAADEGLVILESPKVGYFRRSRTIKGKRAPPSCKEKQTVREGQVLCYIEQLGGEIPIEIPNPIISPIPSPVRYSWGGNQDPKKGWWVFKASAWDWPRPATPFSNQLDIEAEVEMLPPPSKMK